MRGVGSAAMAGALEGGPAEGAAVKAGQVAQLSFVTPPRESAPWSLRCASQARSVAGMLPMSAATPRGPRRPTALRAAAGFTSASRSRRRRQRPV
jgi:hypothetical protein